MRYEKPNRTVVRRPASFREGQRVMADRCLQWLTENPEELARFMYETGHSPASLREALDSIELVRALVDYVAGKEPLLLSICARHGITPEQFMRVWAELNPEA